jgi:exopolysaccharide biosynthesis polyprenyl glycosylphosphotransferase
MIREREVVLEKLSVLMQVILTMLCFYAAWWGTNTFIHPIGGKLKEYQIVFFLIIPMWFLLLDQMGLGKMTRIKMYSTLFVEYITMLSIGMGLLSVVIVILDFSTLSRDVLLVFTLLNFLVLYAYKTTVYAIMKRFRGKGYNTKAVLIIADEESYHFIDRIVDTKDWGFRIKAILTSSPKIKNKYGERFKVLSDQIDFVELIDKKTIDEVMYCKGSLDQIEIRNLIYACAEVGVTFRMQSEFLSVVSVRSQMTYFNQLPFLTFMNTPSNYLALKLKLFLDYIIAGFIVLVISPILLIIALAIKLDDGGPIFFAQTRIGKNGRHFFCLKFRTMVINAEALKDSLMADNEQEGPVFKIKKDPRVTKIGNFLRRTSLDELPQFFNVLRGEMSIVGPRPPVPAEVEQYERWQRRRLSMKPGITCIWQVSGRNNIPFDQWMKMDMQYIDSWSLKLDFVLFLKTIKVMMTGDGQ